MALFDFTSLFQAEHSSRIIRRYGKTLLLMLAGDSLLEVITLYNAHLCIYGTAQTQCLGRVLAILTKLKGVAPISLIRLGWDACEQNGCYIL